MAPDLKTLYIGNVRKSKIKYKHIEKMRQTHRQTETQRHTDQYERTLSQAKRSS